MIASGLLREKEPGADACVWRVCTKKEVHRPRTVQNAWLKHSSSLPHDMVHVVVDVFIKIKEVHRPKKVQNAWLKHFASLPNDMVHDNS